MCFPAPVLGGVSLSALMLLFHNKQPSAEPWAWLGRSLSLRRFGDSVFSANVLRATFVIPIALGVHSIISYTKSHFNTEIAVFEEGVSGLSKKNEKFELKYSEISAVHSQDEGSWKSVNINANGKVFQVYTSKCSEIIAEINKRRKV